jgi:hypothetical protein
MARAFDDTTSKYILLGIDTISPLMNGTSAVSIAARYYLNNTPGDTETIISINGGAGFNVSGMFVNTSRFLQPQGRSSPGGAARGATSTGTLNTSAWNVCGGTLDYANDKVRVFLNGTYESEDKVFDESAYAHSESTRDDDTIGINDADGLQAPCDGNLAEIAFWLTDIGQAGFDTYNAGYSPLLIKPDSLLCYWPLIGRNSPETDLISGLDGTVTGSTAAAHPRVIMPESKHIIAPAELSPIGQKFILPPYRPIIS